MRLLPFLAALLLAPLLSSCADSDPTPAPRADHHVHVRSEAATDAFLHIQQQLGQAPPDSIVNQMPSQIGAEDVVALLDSARIEQATLLSLAYLFGMPEVDFEDEYAQVQAENDYVARQAARYPDRLTAFCSVNPLADYALDEMARCAEERHLDGLKLQFANSAVDLRDSSDTQRLSTVFAEANRLALPIVVHLWTRHPDYGRTDADIFIDDVLTEAPDVPVQVAHLGGGGVFDEATASALQAFEAAIEDTPDRVDNVRFDIGAIALNPAQARGDSARIQQLRAVHEQAARWIERLGAERVVYASDHFARPIPGYVETVRTLPLEDATLRALFENTAPYLH